jgi:hypothetical protein
MPSPLRVALIIPTLDRGGAEKQLSLLAAGLAGHGIEPHVVVLTRDGPLREDLQQAGVPVTLIGKRFKAESPVREAIMITHCNGSSGYLPDDETYNTPAFLAGRRSVLGYPGHIWSHGLTFQEREVEVRAIYAGEPEAGAKLDRWEVGYVLIGPHERAMMPVSDEFFAGWPVVGEMGEYTLLARP